MSIGNIRWTDAFPRIMVHPSPLVGAHSKACRSRRPHQTMEMTMTAPALTSATTVPAPAAVAKTGLLAKVVQVAVNVWTRIRNRRRVHDLLALDDYLLRDLGVARGDVFEALSNPLVNDPTAILAAAANQHRLGECARIRESLRSARLMDEAARRAAGPTSLAA
jgi:uncharacterized protein YjiS (DUF1127 family)